MAANSAENERVLEQCQRDLDLTIERLKILRLDPKDDTGEGAAPDGNNDGGVHHAPAPAPAPTDAGKQSAVPVPSGGRAEWVERLIAEMASAGDMGEDRARAARFLEDFGASVAAAPRPERDVILRENGVLKKAVLVQHRLDKEKDAANLELRGQLARSQERVRSLRWTNYALSMYLRQAQPKLGSMTGPFHQDVF